MDEIIRKVTNEEKARYIENRLTSFDIAMWYAGKKSSHVSRLMTNMNTEEIQIQPDPDRTKLFAVTVH